ncbi:GNAT family N-acetyltransferase [Mucilaginibacter sp. RS28]|uniref:GNAT family N-acetyltransferase n=1 Tax=Mucilaginibacter straminoryzae TaxID=2932774 RepID=A0A9X1X277_9SPHI|nr:GNAT family N-acetyltransferase [Mucilaginibacter straminoryzae]MCJ8209872.1 GNAT family N-acetyltransferase [Mucilaginibacter straminoryzae]
MNTIEIIPYNATLAPYFKSINLEWISEYFKVEPHDIEQLEHPEEIIANGGDILFAKYNDEIVGTCALIKTGEHEYELAKMGILTPFRGKKIGTKLMEAVLKRAKEMGANRLWLGSSTKLPAALDLYVKYGFRHVALKPSPYARADVRMEIEL